MSQEYHVEFPTRTSVHIEEGQPLGEVRTIVEQVAGAVTQAQINAAVEAYIEEHPGALIGLTDEVKQALLQIASKVAYIDDQGAQYYQDLYDALYPPVDLQSISAVYTQSGTVYTTDSLDSLKSDLVVTASYSNGTSETLASTDYTLSGSLTAGTSTITVSYGGKTTTFTVTVTASSLLYNWDFKTSVTDTVQGVTATLGNCSQSSSGIAFNAGTDYITLGSVFGFDKTLEIDYESATAAYGNVNGIWLWTDSGITNGFGHHHSSTAANNKYGYYTSEIWHELRCLLADPCEDLECEVRECERKRHVLFCVTACVSEHHTLVTGSLCVGVFTYDTTVDVHALLMEGRKDAA